MFSQKSILKVLAAYAIWIFLFLFYFSIGAQFNYIRGLYQALTATSLQFTAYYINLKILLPKYYDRDYRKYRFYASILILILSSAGALFELLYNEILPEYVVFESAIWKSAIFSFIFSVVAFWASITTYLIGRQEKINLEIEALKREKAESELKFLKTQINPHFLFNALNNIYSMAYTGDSSTPEKITMLSDMLRYVLYDCESDYISLYKEIDYISSFLEFQQLKTEERQNIEFNLGPFEDNYQIAPMLLVGFVENAFKHSKIEKDRDGFVKIYLWQNPTKFYFSVENSVPEVLLPLGSNTARSGGIGIENAKSRLALMYPDRHQLEIASSENYHKVVLELYK